MSYHLGIDLGTTITTAAVHRDGRSTSSRSASTARRCPPSCSGAPRAHRWSATPPCGPPPTDPARAAREVRPALADPTPLLLDGAPFAAAALLGAMLRRVVDLVAEREGGAPDGIVLTHPATWGAAEREAFAGVAGQPRARRGLPGLRAGGGRPRSTPPARGCATARASPSSTSAAAASTPPSSCTARASSRSLGRPEAVAVPRPTRTPPTTPPSPACTAPWRAPQRLPGDLDAVVLVGWSTRDRRRSRRRSPTSSGARSPSRPSPSTRSRSAPPARGPGPAERRHDVRAGPPHPGGRREGDRPRPRHRRRAPGHREPPVHLGRRARRRPRARPGAPPPRRPRRGLAVALAAGADRPRDASGAAPSP